MASSPVPIPTVQEYMSRSAAADNDPFYGDYKAALAPYLIDVAAPTNAPTPDDVIR